MQAIPIPQVVDPERILGNDRGDFTTNHEPREQLLDEALHETCAYAQQLWHNLDAVRAYLLDSLPPAPGAAGPHPTASASATGRGDDNGWNNWISAYAAVTSVLCGPDGDSGYGLSEGRREATLRRGSPVLRIRTDQPDADGTAARDDQAGLEIAATDARPQGRTRTGRAAATVMLVLLAIRGLRPRRRSHI